MKKMFIVSTVPMSFQFLKFQATCLTSSFEIVPVSSSGEKFELFCNQYGLKGFNVEMSRKINVLKDIVSLLNLIVLFIREKPTVVHSITPKAGLLSMIAARIACVPIRIHTFTGLVFPSKKGLLQKILILMDKITCFCANKIIPEGQGVRNDLLKYDITNKPLNVVGYGNVNGIDTSYFSRDQISIDSLRELESQYGINDADFVLLFVGRLVGDKGINELVSAFKEISINRSNIKLLLVGPRENDLDPLNKVTINEIEKNDNIIEAGWQTDVRPFMAISDLFVFPSYREGFPNVVMQAGAMGLASIVTNINGSNEIIVDGENGLMISSKNIVALKEAIELLISDEIKRRKIEDNARNMIQKRYEQQFVWNELLKMYREELDKNGIKHSL
ncbi:MAG: glycosyltransferase family 4 protein [Prolixibacteraceae bacterium]|jgi:glycosyltransferase involved in cell wall biosynthesis|nr:glycosyltransferase family 4 protein [Prolixibacteraceae bacterium]